MSTEGTPTPPAVPSVDKPTGLARLGEGSEREVQAFLEAGYPHRRPELLLPRWKWMFLDSARRLGRDPLVWVYRKAGRIVAHQGVIPVTLQVDGEQLPTGWFVETMVLEDNRAGTIGPGVIIKTKQDLPFSLSLGQTQMMRAIQFKLGWVQVAPLETLVLPLRSRQVLQGKLGSAPLRLAAAAALAARQMWGRLRIRRARDVEVRQLQRFGPEHDRLWSRVEKDYPCAVVRDSSYLNWKYVDQPGQEFIRLEIRRRGEPVALVVLKLIPPTRDYHYIRSAIVAFIAPAYDAPVLWAALDAARKVSLACGAGSLVLSLISKPVVPRALEYGFLRRDPTRVFLVCAEGLPADLRERVLNPDNWLVTMGDSDIDRPEFPGDMEFNPSEGG